MVIFNGAKKCKIRLFSKESSFFDNILVAISHFFDKKTRFTGL